jgi:hypothetical protein
MFPGFNAMICKLLTPEKIGKHLYCLFQTQHFTEQNNNSISFQELCHFAEKWVK